MALSLGYWLLCAAVSAAIASDKQRSGPGFFFLALLFLGPLAVGVAVLAAPGSSLPAPQTDAAVRRPGQTSTGAPDGAAEDVEPDSDWRPKATTLRAGDRVKVVAEDSKHSGKEGKVSSVETTGYVTVRFGLFVEDVFDPDELVLL